MTNFKEFPDSRKYEPSEKEEMEGQEFDAAGYIQEISLWFTALKAQLHEEMMVIREGRKVRPPIYIIENLNKLNFIEDLLGEKRSELFLTNEMTKT